MLQLSETQMSLQHILGNGRGHEVWHQTFPDKEKECPYHERLSDLELYVVAREQRAFDEGQAIASGQQVANHNSTKGE